MTIIDRSALLPYTARQMFDLVCDIEAYPDYMDGCVGAEVMKRDAGTVEARLDLAKGGIKQSFTTRNRPREFEQIELELLQGPFDSFSGCWTFQALGDVACKISLQLEFKSNSALLGVAAARLFDAVTNNLVEAVARRARVIYG